MIVDKDGSITSVHTDIEGYYYETQEIRLAVYINKLEIVSGEGNIDNQ